MTFTRSVSTGNYGPAKFIVDGTTTANGTHSTIAAALAVASSGDTIFIRPGTYTENPTISTSGITLCGMGGNGLNYDGTSLGVTITGKISFTHATGITKFANIQFNSNSDNIFSVTGTAAPSVYVQDSYFYSTTNVFMLNSSSGGGRYYLYRCNGNLGGTAVAVFNVTGAGTSLIFNDCHWLNGGSTTASTLNATGTTVSIIGGQWQNGLTLQSSSAANFHNTSLTVTGLGAAMITTSSTATFVASNSRFTTDGQAVASIGAGTVGTMVNCALDSSAANVLTGAGTLKYAVLSFMGTSSGHNVTTETNLASIL